MPRKESPNLLPRCLGKNNCAGVLTIFSLAWLMTMMENFVIPNSERYFGKFAVQSNRFGFCCSEDGLFEFAPHGQRFTSPVHSPTLCPLPTPSPHACTACPTRALPRALPPQMHSNAHTCVRTAPARIRNASVFPPPALDPQRIHCSPPTLPPSFLLTDFPTRMPLRFGGPGGPGRLRSLSACFESKSPHPHPHPHPRYGRTGKPPSSCEGALPDCRAQAGQLLCRGLCGPARVR
jgi:hypothetical protein